MDAPTIPEAIKALEAEIGLPPAFFECIAREDDWSFIIKLHALIEHCVTTLIVRRTKGIGLDEVVARLRFNDTRTGKLAVAKGLELLSPEYLDFIKAVCEIRNAYVHDVNCLSMPLSEYIKDHPRRADLARRVCRLMETETSLQGHAVPATDVFIQHPKIALEVAAMDLLSDIYLGHERARLAVHREQLAQEALALVGSLRRTPDRGVKHG